MDTDKFEKPKWKQSRDLYDKERIANFVKGTIKEELPKNSFRLGVLEDRDNQLNQLLDYLESIGIPMGSTTWAKRALLRIQKLEKDNNDLNNWLNRDERDMRDLINRLKHNRNMYRKFLPEPQISCDYCGWHGAKPIGGGYAACEDCTKK